MRMRVVAIAVACGLSTAGVAGADGVPPLSPWAEMRAILGPPLFSPQVGPGPGGMPGARGAAPSGGKLLPFAMSLELPLEPFAHGRNGTFAALFGFAPMRSAIVLPAGALRVMTSVESWKSTLPKEPDDATPPSVPATGTYFRFRGNRFDEWQLGFGLGMGKGFEMSLGVTFANLREGSGDIILNRNGYVHVAQLDRNANFGNVLFGLRYGVPLGGPDNPHSGLGVALDLKLPVGDPDDFVTSGTTDVAFTICWTERLKAGEQPILMHLNLGLMMPTGSDRFFQHPPVAAVTPAPAPDDEIDAAAAFAGGLGFTWKVSGWLGFLTSFEFNTSPYSGASEVEGFAFSAHLGARVLLGNVVADASLGNDLTLGDASLVTARLSFAFLIDSGLAKSGDRPAAGPSAPRPSAPAEPATPVKPTKPARGAKPKR